MCLMKVNLLFVLQALLAASDFLPVLLKRLVDPEFAFSDQISTILSNLSRDEKTCKIVFKVSRITSGHNSVLVYRTIATPAGCTKPVRAAWREENE